jgi:membrane fusion protein, multidrug efflux system
MDKHADYQSPDKNNSENGVSWYTKKRVIIPTLILVVIALAAGIYWFKYIRGYESTDDAFIDNDNITISSKILGRIAHLNGDEGDTIKAGQQLVLLDDSDLKAQETLAKANLEYARKNAEMSFTNLQKAQSDFKRADIQLKGNAITREQYDHAKQALNTAEAQYASAQSQIETGTAQLNVIQTQLTNTQINSPFAGIIAKRWVIEGDVVQAAQPIFTVYSIEGHWVSAYLEETKISYIKIGAPVEINIDAYPGSKFYGRVAEIGATAASQFSLIPPNNASGNFTKVTQRIPIKIAIDTPSKQYSLKAGMSVEIKINTKEE